MKVRSIGSALRRSLVALAFFGAISSPAVASFTQLVFFGDSLSDTGNVFLSTGGAVPASPPYFNGRFSNGPLWTEILAGDLGRSATPSLLGGTNFAFAGATVIDYGRPTPELPQQLGLYFAATGGVADPNALYVILGGANDINDALKDPATAAVNIINGAIAIDAMIDALYAAGARNLLVGNLPDIGKTPLAAAAGPAVVAGATALTDVFNGTLSALLSADVAGHAGLSLDRLDLHTLLDAAVASPAAFGFTNVTDPCKLGATGAPGPVCATPDSFLFWDAFHPSARGHELIAATALAAVPEPAALLLVVAGLIAMLAMRRSRNNGVA